MLELKNIKKVYPVGDGEVKALKGISLAFRKSEFVSILGPSGCGKTTMLNIIGGLDKYSEGDLVINNLSTKKFTDRDWDAYRNHKVGFVFQSYNLIPHQSVLQNVELALTLSGVGKEERRKRAIGALEKVGLGDQLKKKPSEMSGGQMQRVAIARAIVNDPDIILADEPTGALDTETSVQVMEILKEISQDRLVIMVTHNPDLANQYSTRIVRMLDGVITDDTAPYTDFDTQGENEQAVKGKRVKPQKKPSMSFATSFSLSLKNLFTKKGRTALTSFAGSIGIIGIALIFAVSHGTTSYIDKVQEDTLASYPITIEKTQVDMGKLMETFIGKSEGREDHENDAVYSNPIIYDLLNSLTGMDTTENDLESFKKYLEKEYADKESETGLSDAVTGIQYTYAPEMTIYTKSSDDEIYRSDTKELMQDLLAEYFGMDMSSMLNIQENYGISSDSMFSFGGPGMVLWQEILAGDDGKMINPLMEKQYDMVYGSWPNSYDEIVLVLNEDNELDDMALYALGLKSKADIDEIMEAAVNKTEIEATQQSWSYEEICNMEFRAVVNSDKYSFDKESGTYLDLSETEAGRKYLYDNGITLKVSGIIRPSEEAVATMLTGSIGFTKNLTEYLIIKAGESETAKYQQSKPDVDIFTGLPFKESTGKLTAEEKKAEFIKYISGLDQKAKADTYVKIMSIPPKEQIDATVSQMVDSKTAEQIAETLKTVLTSQVSVEASQIDTYISSMSEEDMREMYSKMVEEQYKMQYAQNVKESMARMPAGQLAMALDGAFKGYTDEQYSTYYDEVLTFSESTYEDNLVKLGNVDLESPQTVNIYASTFESKEVIEEVIAEYNKDVDEISQITYTDYIGLMMSSVTTVINAITYVLIAFVAVSLIVSSIMIGVITLISVQERTKEIGILRAIGASKRNVSSMFNAETVIIGFTSGMLGVVITYLLCIPINLILHKVTGIPTLSAQLPIAVAVVLVLISMLLTLFAGIIPSRSAAKKDPVVALRTE